MYRSRPHRRHCTPRTLLGHPLPPGLPNAEQDNLPIGLQIGRQTARSYDRAIPAPQPPPVRLLTPNGFGQSGVKNETLRFLLGASGRPPCDHPPCNPTVLRRPERLGLTIPDSLRRYGAWKASPHVTKTTEDLVLPIHGTFAQSDGDRGTSWWQLGSATLEQLRMRLPQGVRLPRAGEPFHWSGANTERRGAKHRWTYISTCRSLNPGTNLTTWSVTVTADRSFGVR